MDGCFSLMHENKTGLGNTENVTLHKNNILRVAHKKDCIQDAYFNRLDMLYKFYQIRIMVQATKILIKIKVL